MTDSVRTRFAPSPTGDLHVGGARTALFNWLFTRNRGGEFILRIEDTDFDRSADKYIDRIISAMKWLGLDWDEGPETGGPYAPYYQSKRLNVYEEVIEKLKKKDKVYRCYCTKKELEQQRQRQRDRGEAPRYSGRCRDLDPEKKKQFEEEGRDFTYRYRIPRKPVTVNDVVKGDVSFPPDQVGDFIIIKSNGSPSYNFAVVVDDHRMDITHVIRGDDHLSNTPRQLYLYDALGWEPPTWCHLAMILGEDGDRLSKRHGATDVEEYRKDGYLPEAMLNALALLGWSPPDGVEYKSIPELIDSFGLDRVSKSSSQFDLDKFRYLNGQHLRDLEAKEIIDRLEPDFSPEAIEPDDRDNLEEIVEVLRDHLTLLTDFRDLYRTFFKEPIEPTDEAIEWINDQDSARQYLEVFRNRLDQESELTPDATGELIGSVREETGGSGRSFYLPLRIGITGRKEGPEFHEIMPVIGAERCVKRIDIILKRVDEFSHA
jgi:nondiscriminating glutamyl-tRNA synthetase